MGRSMRRVTTHHAACREDGLVILRFMANIQHENELEARCLDLVVSGGCIVLYNPPGHEKWDM